MGQAIDTREKQIELHLKQYGSITSWEAFEKYGITRLSARIYNLRRYHNILSKQITTTNRYGNTVNYVRYVYMGEINAEV